VSSLSGLTALVLAGSRSGGDPLAAYAGVSHKALIQIGGRKMLERVIEALAQSPQISRILVAIERPEIVSELPQHGKPVLAIHAAEGLSASVAFALRSQGTPLLITTADHPLLTAPCVAEFLGNAPDTSDVAIALARREVVTVAAPITRRTYLRFADGEYSGCNLFLLQRPTAARMVDFWQRIEAERKQPVRMLRRLGVSYLRHPIPARMAHSRSRARTTQRPGRRESRRRVP
jgi:GTP:adenosylcobinamide-phosphate guanylyltransferase